MRQTHSKQRNGQEPNLQKVLAIKTLNLRDAASLEKSLHVFAHDRRALEHRFASQRVSFLIPAARYPGELYLIKLSRQTQNHRPKVVLVLNNTSLIIIFQHDSHLVVVGSYPKQPIASFGSNFQGAKHGELFTCLNRQPNICFREPGYDRTISTGRIGCSQDQSNTCNASLFIEGGIDSKGVPNRSKCIAVRVLASRVRVQFPSCLSPLTPQS